MLRPPVLLSETPTTNDRGVPVRRLIRATMAAMASLALVAPTAIPAEATLPDRTRTSGGSTHSTFSPRRGPTPRGTASQWPFWTQASMPTFPISAAASCCPARTSTGAVATAGRTTTVAHGHGTSMASLIAAQGTGPSGFVGVAPGAKILPIQISLSGDGRGEAIRYAVDHGAKVISISQGAPSGDPAKICPSDVQDAVTYAAKHNVVILAASGNSGNAGNAPEYPGRMSRRCRGRGVRPYGQAVGGHGSPELCRCRRAGREHRVHR